MTCPTASLLRFGLYSLSTQYTDITIPLRDSIISDIKRERKSPEYQQALEALRNHLKECEVCQQSKRME